jgi:hypothetical protein
MGMKETSKAEAHIRNQTALQIACNSPMILSRNNKITLHLKYHGTYSVVYKTRQSLPFNFSSPLKYYLALMSFRQAESTLNGSENFKEGAMYRAITE